MKRFNRYLLFYLILGIGLAIAWTQVGRRMQLAPNAGLRIMTVDEVCDPSKAPCAAYAGHFALILGPGNTHEELLLIGEKLPADSQLSVEQLDVHSLELPSPLLRSMPDNRWLVVPADKPGRLRVNLSAAGQQWVAEFPL